MAAKSVVAGLCAGQILLAAVVMAQGNMFTNVKVEKIGSGYRFTEGPVWTLKNTLLFTDIPANRIRELAPEPVLSQVEGARVFREPSGNSNGLTLDSEGRLIACEHSNRRVTRTEKDGAITVLADRFDGKKFNSPNDVVVKSDGGIYFTDPTYGVKPEDRELDFQGVYRIGKDGTVDLPARDFVQPNGLCFSPDEKLLYVADSSDLRHIRVFDVQADGTLTASRVFAKIAAPQGGPDGMKIDTQGRLYVAGPKGVWVFDTAGKHLGTIPVPEIPANIAWGDSDGKTLYITARTGVYKAKLDVGGRLPGRKK